MLPEQLLDYIQNRTAIFLPKVLPLLMGTVMPQQFHIIEHDEFSPVVFHPTDAFLRAYVVPMIVTYLYISRSLSLLY